MRLLLTTAVSTIFLYACAISKYQSISHNELEKYYGAYVGDEFNSDLTVLFENVKVDLGAKRIKISGKVIGTHLDEPIVNAGVSMVEFKGNLKDSMVKKSLGTDSKGYFEIEDNSVNHDDRLNISMIGYNSIYYRVGALIHSED